jgi:hypothetical protein
VDGYTTTAEQERATDQEGATDREVVDENLLEFLLRASGDGCIVKATVFTLSMMRPKSHVTITVKPTSEQVLMEYKREQTFILTIFLINVRRWLLIRVTGVCDVK